MDSNVAKIVFKTGCIGQGGGVGVIQGPKWGPYTSYNIPALDLGSLNSLGALHCKEIFCHLRSFLVN